MALDERPTAQPEPAADQPPPDDPPSRLGRVGRLDAVDMLTVYFGLAFFLPGWLRISALGEAGRPSILFGVALFGWWVISRIAPTLTPRNRQPLHFFVWIYLIAFLSAVVAAYGRGLTFDEMSGMERRILTMLSMVGVLLVAADGVRDRRRVTTLLRRIVLFAVFPAIVGALQFALELDLSIKINVPGLEQGPIPWQRSRGNYVRSWGTSLHAIEFGVVMAMLMGIAVHLALHAKLSFERHLMWTLAGLYGVVGVFANSRTQMVAVACVMLPLVAAWRANWRIRAGVVAAAAIAAMTMLIPGLISGLVDLFLNIGSDESAEAREVDYPVVFEQIADRPWLGVGPGTRGVTEENVAETAGNLLDNDWLGTLLTQGIIGVIALALLYFGALSLARRVYRWGYDEEWRHLGALLFGIIIAAMATSYLFDAFYYSQFTALTFTAIGLAGAAYRINREGPFDEQRRDLHVLRRRRTLDWQPYRPTLAPPRGEELLADGIERAGDHIEDVYDDLATPPSLDDYPNPLVRRRVAAESDDGTRREPGENNPLVKLIDLVRD